MLNAMKLALRINNIYFDAEVQGLINACIRDLKLAGINAKKISDDPLIQRAVSLYCKANFGNNPDSEKFIKAYESLKTALSLDGDYRE